MTSFKLRVFFFFFKQLLCSSVHQFVHRGGGNHGPLSYLRRWWGVARRPWLSCFRARGLGGTSLLLQRKRERVSPSPNLLSAPPWAQSQGSVQHHLLPRLGPADTRTRNKDSIRPLLTSPDPAHHLPSFNPFLPLTDASERPSAASPVSGRSPRGSPRGVSPIFPSRQAQLTAVAPSASAVGIISAVGRPFVCFPCSACPGGRSPALCRLPIDARDAGDVIGHSSR